MTQPLKLLVEDYCRGGTADNFLHIRSAIAQMLINSGNSIDPRVFDVKDDNFIAKHNIQLPGLAEACRTTQKHDSIIEYIVHGMYDSAQAIIVNGSANWGRYYSVYNNSKKKSDIDIDIIFDELSAGLTLGNPQLQYELNLFQSYQSRNLADMLMSKIYIDGFEVSLHFIPLQKLNMILNYPYETTTSPFSLRAFRTKLPDRRLHRYGPTYNFVHDVYYYDMRPVAYEDGFVTGQPFMMVGNHQEFVMAVSLHKLIVLSRVYGAMKDELELAFKRMIYKIAQRKKAETEMLDGNPTFRNLLAKVDRMPQFLQAKIEDFDRI